MALILSLGGCSQNGQDSPNSIDLTLENLAWLEGNWTGPGFEGTVEEHWSAPAGKSIVSLFRLVIAGQTRVLELRTLLEEEKAVILRLNHFTPALRRWEREQEPLVYQLVGLTSSRAVFDGLKVQEGSPGRIIYEQVRGELTIELQSQGRTTSKLHLRRY